MITQPTSRVLGAEFDYWEPGTLQEAVEMLSAAKDRNVSILAGGTDLLVKMKIVPLIPDVVMDISRIAELREIRRHDDAIVIGATATFVDVAENADVRAHLQAVAQGAAAVSHLSIRHMGTIGGNFGNASPAADTPPPFIALGASCILQSAAGVRKVSCEDFFLGPGRTVMERGELLTAIEVPIPPAASGSSFAKIGRVAADIAIVNAAAFIVRNGDRVASCRIALGSVAPTPIRARRAEEVVIGQTLTESIVQQAAAAAADEASPIDDVRASAKYRTHLVRVLVRRVLWDAWEQAGRTDR